MYSQFFQWHMLAEIICVCAYFEQNKHFNLVVCHYPYVNVTLIKSCWIKSKLTFSFFTELHRQCSKFVDTWLSTSDDVDGNEETSKRSKTTDVLISAEMLTTLEESYARSHQFLASTLNEMTQKRNVPHLDGLAASLIHSCPEVKVAE